MGRDVPTYNLSPKGIQMKHKIEHPHSTVVLSASACLPTQGKQVVVIAAGIDGEANAERVVQVVLEQHGVIVRGDDVVLFWSTPSAFSVTGSPLLRRLFVAEDAFEWGPPLQITDTPEVHESAARCNAELMSMTL